MEKILSFVLDHELRSLPFYIELAGITYPDPHYEIKRACSEFYVLEYVVSGKGHVTVNGESFRVSAGDVYLLPLGCSCHYYSDPETPCQKIWMNINGDLCRHLIHAYHLDNKYHFEQACLSKKFEQIIAICENKSLKTSLVFAKCSRILFEIIQSLYMDFYEEAAMNEHVLAAKQYCDANICEKISMKDISAAANLSVSQLNRLFKKEIGKTVYSYLLDCRIELSKSLLRGSGMSIRQIADKLNFADEHYFSNIFKKKTSYSPKEYRQQGKQLDPLCNPRRFHNDDL